MRQSNFPAFSQLRDPEGWSLLTSELPEDEDTFDYDASIPGVTFLGDIELNISMQTEMLLLAYCKVQPYNLGPFLSFAQYQDASAHTAHILYNRHQALHMRNTNPYYLQYGVAPTLEIGFSTPTLASAFIHEAGPQRKLRVASLVLYNIHSGDNSPYYWRTHQISILERSPESGKSS
mmetsp:Transcript_35668/g.57724  ORF Transcript_35668/g.57724 Transcript_35668/m.57724 type:complete len:177 (+) Transcript_35668:393-923(+)|eukprot:CAMPEP_0184664092 /NCGR_PEP_ID=MMETSP0308-20130426/51245_1 /TAXON_ID=38269 /ORGANISM="Gloeochaete witrockiana, Strain SAG 46.84" /LENGTH=176 /DNA_ID=CAMNT_0027107263 /DNA_START=382 /DNA_END=912 /DNA_ORIENTATION=+